ncbi:MAG: VWA domain-containing protein [Candidatus Acidiferrales bacterium]
MDIPSSPVALRRPTAIVIGLFATIAFTCSAGGRQNVATESRTPSASPRSTHLLRSTTRLVQLSVIVDGRHGRPIAGLSKNDFELWDNGHRQTIQLFLTHESDPASSRPAALPPDTYSNRLSDHTIPMSATVILLDGLNTKITDQQYALQQVVRFLGQIRPQDRVALYTLGTNLTLVHDFTNDAKDLLTALHGYKGQISPEFEMPPQLQRRDRSSRGGRAGLDGSGASNNVLTPVLKVFNASERNVQLSDRVGRTVWALERIADHVALLPGRKNLVWVSGSFLAAADLQDVEMNTPDGGLLFTTDLTGVARMLNNTSMVVYPVDARGLLVGGLFGAFGDTDPRNFEIMDEIAHRTGGYAFYSTNDIFNSIRRAVDDSRVSYELGYYPDTVKWDGTFHRVRIKVLRHGMHVRAREGYFANPGSSLTPEDKTTLLGEAAANLFDADGIAVTVKVRSTNESPRTGRSIQVSVLLDSGALTLHQEASGWTGGFDTVFVQVDGKSAVLNATDDPIRFMLSADQYRQVRRHGGSYTETVNLSPQASQLRVVVRDTSSGKIGSVGIPLAHYFPSTTPPPRS